MDTVELLNIIGFIIYIIFPLILIILASYFLIRHLKETGRIAKLFLKVVRHSKKEELIRIIDDLIKIPPNKLTIINRFKKRLEKYNGDVFKTLEEKEFKNYRNEIRELMEKLAPISLNAPFANKSSNADKCKHRRADYDSGRATLIFRH